MQNDSHPKTFDGGVEGHAVNSCHIDHVVRHAHEHDQGRSALSSPPKYKAAGIKPGPSDQLTKTPSADHDDGNLRGLSAPNHQPHAVSQGWRTDLENAPGGVRFLIAGRSPHGSWDAEESYRHYAGHFNGRKIDPPTHWMPLPAPPSPAKTDPAPSSVEEWGR